MKARWLAVVGIGEDGELTARARALIDGAEALVGGARHLDMIPDDGRPRLTWPRPLSGLVPRIAEFRGRPVCVLATGDPMFFGVGVTLVRHFAIEEMEIVPSPSAFSLAAARMGWPLADAETLTLHGRPPALIVPFILPGARLLVLTDGSGTPAEVSRLLVERGYGGSALIVLEHMGGEQERRLTGRADSWSRDDVAPFHTLAVECVAGPGAVALPRLAGLPDETFASDGNVTRREVRAATLAALAPLPGQRLWDVGAGCGSVAVEWMRAHAGNRAVAVERKPDRAALIARNATALGAPRLEIVQGEAPAALAALDPPDAVFVGGGAAVPGLLDRCWAALPANGRLVANAVTLEGETALARFRAERGGALCRISVSRAEPVGSFTGWRPAMTVTQYAAVKA